jgi:hypothetical protein
MNKVGQQANREQWMRHVSAWNQSGVSQSAYCRTHGLVLGTFHAWVGRVKRMGVEAPAPLTMVPVVVQPDVDHAQLSSRLSLQHHSGWQLQLPAGTEANWLGKVLKELA